MDKLIIKGFAPLSGEVSISGSKNAGLPIIVSTLLVHGKSVITNIPSLVDIKIMLNFLSYFGAKICFNNSSVIIDTSNLIYKEGNCSFARKIRASILALGPLLNRFGRASISLPGGCSIGARPINLHLDGLKAMGVDIFIENDLIKAKIGSSGLNSALINLNFASVGATQHLMTTAVFVNGEVIINNAAKEPEIVDLANALKKMGANIYGEGTSNIKISGVNSLNFLNYNLPADRIEASTFIAIAAISGSKITLKNIQKNQFNAIFDVFKKMGCNFKYIIDEDSNNNSILLEICGPKKLLSINLSTDVYPGFPSDMQAQFMACMTLANGVSYIKENIFENRFMHVSELNRLGARISINGKYAIVKGVQNLYGTNVIASDLRGSASLVIAALKANGTTIISRINHLDRGYVNLEKKLFTLGANIKRISNCN